MQFFFKHSDKSFYPREVEKLTGVPYTAVRRELQSLEEVGLFICEKNGNHSYYRLNEKFLFFHDLKMIFLKVERRALLEEEFWRIVPILISLSPEKIVLFGDLVEGKAGRHSEIGLLIVKGSRKDFWERTQDILEKLKPQMALTLIFITPSEAKRLLDSGLTQFQQIYFGGETIYEKKKA